MAVQSMSNWNCCSNYADKKEDQPGTLSAGGDTGNTKLRLADDCVISVLRRKMKRGGFGRIETQEQLCEGYFSATAAECLRKKQTEFRVGNCLHSRVIRVYYLRNVPIGSERPPGTSAGRTSSSPPQGSKSEHPAAGGRGP